MRKVFFLLLLTACVSAQTSYTIGTNAHLLSSVYACVAASNSGTAYTCSTSPTFTTNDGDLINLKTDVANTGPATLNVNGSSPISIVSNGAALVPGQLQANSWYTLKYNSTSSTWQVTDRVTGTGTSAGGSSGQIEYNNAGAFGGFTVSGDGTLNTSTGALIVTKTNGTAFAPSATTDTTNASNIASGTLSSSRLPSAINLGTGSTVSMPSYYEFQAGLCQNTTAILGLSSPTSNAPTAVCLTETNTQKGVAQFTASGQTLQGRFLLPPDWVGSSGNDLTFVFTDVTDTTTSHNEVWNLQTACVATSQATTDPSAWNTAQTGSVAVQGTAAYTNNVTISTFTTTGCSANNMLYFKIGLDSSRTATGNANLISIRFKVKRTITTL